MPSSIPFGVFELDTAGTVIHYSPPLENDRARRTKNVLGRNFFNDLVPGLEIKELKNRFLSFMVFGDAVQRFSKSVQFGESVVKIQIVMARINEHSGVGSKRFALVRVMPDQMVSPSNGS